MVKIKYTPNTYSYARTMLHRSREEYKKVRSAYFRDLPNLNPIERSDQLHKLLEARIKVSRCRCRVHTIEDTGIEFGVPTSPKAVVRKKVSVPGSSSMPEVK